MNNVLIEVGGSGISIGVAAYASAAAVLLLMMTLWLTDRKKRTGQPIASGQVINGIGYGLLPMLTVLRAFQEPDAGTGTVVTEPLPLVQWLSTEGRYMYCRIEIVALLACFVLLTLWLIMRGCTGHSCFLDRQESDPSPFGRKGRHRYGYRGVMSRYLPADCQGNSLRWKSDWRFCSHSWVCFAGANPDADYRR